MLRWRTLIVTALLKTLQTPTYPPSGARNLRLANLRDPTAPLTIPPHATGAAPPPARPARRRARTGTGIESNRNGIPRRVRVGYAYRYGADCGTGVRTTRRDRGGCRIVGFDSRRRAAIT